MPKPKPAQQDLLKLKAEVTPLMLWHRTLRVLYRTLMLTLWLAGLGAAAWGVKAGLDHLVYQNPDYTLRHLELNANEAVTERDFIELTGLDLNANIYRVRTRELARILQTHPPVRSATVTRKPPGTLVVTVEAREPLVWLASPDAGLPAGRQPGALLLAADGTAYPCPALQFERAAALPIVLLDAREAAPIRAGESVRHPQLGNLLRLLDTARQRDGGNLEWIDSVRQSNEWSLALTTRRGVVATFGLDDHARQLAYLVSSLEHAATKGYAIATINLIPRRNVPVTLASETIPRAIPVPEPGEDEPAPPAAAREAGPF